MNEIITQYTGCMVSLCDTLGDTLYKTSNYNEIKHKYGAIASLTEIASIASDIVSAEVNNIKISHDIDKLIKRIIISFEVSDNILHCKYDYILNKDKSISKSNIYVINRYIETNLTRYIKVHTYQNKDKEMRYVYIDFEGKLKFRDN